MSDYGSEGWGFESLRARRGNRRSEQVLALAVVGSDIANCARGGAHTAHDDAAQSTYHRPASALLLDMTPRLVDIAARDHRASWATLGASQPDEAPLPDEGERELVYREGYGWVSRPVEVEPVVVPVEAPRREIAWVA